MSGIREGRGISEVLNEGNGTLGVLNDGTSGVLNDGMSGDLSEEETGRSGVLKWGGMSGVLNWGGGEVVQPA